MKTYNNVKILETDLEREYFTKRGLNTERFWKGTNCSETGCSCQTFSKKEERFLPFDYSGMKTLRSRIKIET
jgi:hypothetical protein